MSRHSAVCSLTSALSSIPPSSFSNDTRAIAQNRFTHAVSASASSSGRDTAAVALIGGGGTAAARLHVEASPGRRTQNSSGPPPSRPQRATIIGGCSVESVDVGGGKQGVRMSSKIISADSKVSLNTKQQALFKKIQQYLRTSDRQKFVI
jgi:hypothetical protein